MKMDKKKENTVENPQYFITQSQKSAENDVKYLA